MNTTSILLFLAILPVVVILLFVNGKDKHKEPFVLLMKLFVFGIISCFLVLLVSDVMELFLPFMNYSSKSDFISTLLYAFIGIALVEECCKWVMVYFIGYNSKDFDERYDIIVYSVFVSLGFAFFENILYVFFSENNFTTAIFRALSAVPGHACDAVFMGYYLSVAKEYKIRGNNDLEKKNIILSILIPTCLHGIYDFCIMSGYTILMIAFFVFVVLLYIISINKLSEISAANKKIKFNNRFCPKCGAIVEGEFCPRCGTHQD